MTQEQLIIGNAILKYISDKNGCCASDDLYEFLNDGTFDLLDLKLVQNRIREQNLLNKTEVLTTLNMEGSKAARMGYPAYCKYLQGKDDDLDVKNHSHATLARWQVNIFWPLAAWSVISLNSGDAVISFALTCHI